MKVCKVCDTEWDDICLDEFRVFTGVYICKNCQAAVISILPVPRSTKDQLLEALVAFK